MHSNPSRATALRWMPWTGADGRLSPLKLAVFLALLYPAGWMLLEWNKGIWMVPQADLTYWSGVWAIWVLLASLAVTPARRILRWGRLLQVRRMIGVAALLYTIAHLVIYFWLRFWNWAEIGTEVVTRLSLILATLALIGLIALGATSFDAAVRAMGAGWRRLHWWTYPVTTLAVIHFLLSPGSFAGMPFLVLGCFAWLMGWRWLEARRRGTAPGALLALTAVAAAVTLAAEALMPWWLLDADPAFTLSLNVSFLLGVTPVYKVAALGLAITAAAWLRNRV
ncbi:sulfite oxidase heme-binding subunit YedZ [Pseudoroseicyclus sp. CXY001]|uniref:sulfite oxidase heme-binding subunit YedZ n=1 Tax=Pseudoroseicyclus sp. CXY001 TaxID=3242492 RepID=UPI0035712424